MTLHARATSVVPALAVAFAVMLAGAGVARADDRGVLARPSAYDPSSTWSFAGGTQIATGFGFTSDTIGPATPVTARLHVPGGLQPQAGTSHPDTGPVNDVTCTEPVGDVTQGWSLDCTWTPPSAVTLGEQFTLMWTLAASVTGANTAVLLSPLGDSNPGNDSASAPMSIALRQAAIPPPPTVTPPPSALPPTPVLDAQGDYVSPLAPPSQGVATTAGAVTGTVRVRIPGARSFTTLKPGGVVPVGSVVDVRSGRAQLFAAVGRGAADVLSGTFAAGTFTISQGRSSRTVDIRLARPTGCTQPRRATASRQADDPRFQNRVRARERHTKKGNFRTLGGYSSGSAIGTSWVTIDRCSSTTTQVLAGLVRVRDVALGRAVTLAAGGSYTARAR